MIFEFDTAKPVLGSGTNVKGEVYEVDNAVLANLDILEDHPNYYVREQRKVRSLDNNSSITAWIYFIKSFKPDLLKRQMFESYSNTDSHGLKYVPRYLRNDTVDHKTEIIA